MHRLLRALACALPLLLTACKNPETPVPRIETTTFAPSLGVDLSQMTKTSSGLYWRDLTVGTGSGIAWSGMHPSVYYTGWLANGTQFDARQPPQDPFTFTLGVGQVIAGWDEGIVGMRVGGKRQLIIPPALGYGEIQVGPIPSNSILVFTVELVGLQ